MKAKQACILIFILLLTLVHVGCSIRAVQLRSQPLATTEVVTAGKQTDAKFLIYPFDDLRGNEFLYLYPTSVIPIFNLFHIGSCHKYPETAALLRGQQGMKPFCSVGSLDTSFPYLLAETMRNMKLTNNVVPIDEANVKVNLSEYDYIIRGKLNKTELETHVNIIPLGILSILGAPVAFHNFTLNYEIQLFESSNMQKPIFTETYSRDLTAAQGMYYGQSACFDLFIEALEKTLPLVVNDIASKIK